MRKILFAVLLCWVVTASAGKQLVAKGADFSVFLTDEACESQAVTNLPKKAIWVDKNNNRIAGCWGFMHAAGSVLFYFDDKTVVLIPARMFAPAQDI